MSNLVDEPNDEYCYLTGLKGRLEIKPEWEKKKWEPLGSHFLFA